MSEKTIRVLVVDDSAFMRMVLKDIIDSQPDMKVVGFAKDGLEAVEKAIELKPDVITMDVEMPNLNGIEALKLIMRKAPTRVIMVSSLTEEGAAITIEALRNGAVDFITKPHGSVSMTFRQVAPELLEKIRQAMNVDPRTLLFRPKVSRLTINKPAVGGKIVVIGSSTGGPRSLDMIIPNLPKNFPAPIVVVQHMPPGFTKSLAMRLDSSSELSVKEAEEGEEPKPGYVYIAPGDYHLGLKVQNGKVSFYLDRSDKINNVRPAADFTLDKAAEIYKSKTIAVILTGMGKDGTKGAFKVKFYGGKVIAESEETCVVFGMPKSVIEEGYADYVLPAYKIPEKLIELV
ncbi:chemotaxis response regulator protein-glutamate methylesterase [Thermotoga sp. SG1]|uniref:protein-glutamate methylesterase/protein-glutamine glutaminase n=1 Tax=Thermotoga sp. SG1 TaxID=126739 RepID=UPI000C768848|nr:chemotaxis response regulator protein-glutamate methylesterase [Thermotoga sp. SG1]PLV57331.1 chemotaxis response regulator protein-glutamate methylesterase [Thermotoga sp. SG1]